MAQIRTGDAHGLYRVFIGLVDDAGYNYGTAGPGVLPGTMMSPYMVRYATDASLTLPDRTVIDFTGGDVWTGAFVYGITSLGTFEMTLSTADADLSAMLSGSRVDGTLNARQTIWSDNIMESSPPQAWMLIVFRIQSKDPGSVGANKFISILLPRTWATPKGFSSGPAFQAHSPTGYTVVPTTGDRFPWGLPFACTDMGLSNNMAPNVYIITDNPVHTVGYIARPTQATETVTLPFLPIAPISAPPDSETDSLQTYINGRKADADSVSLTTAAVTISPLAPATEFAGGEYIGIFYETHYVSSSAGSIVC